MLIAPKEMHNLSFIAFIALGVVLYWTPIADLSHLVNKSELYSHIPLIPIVSGYFLVADRKDIFRNVSWEYWKGAALLGIAVLVRWFGEGCLLNPNPNDCLSVHMLGFVIWIQGCFALSYGGSALKRALFPLLFLVFLIPIPTFILNPFVRFLQLGSAEAAYHLFKAAGTPVFRDGFLFSLPGLTIEVAEQCSGIRSTIALFITAVVAGKLFLQKPQSRGILILAVLPITIFKNGLRIVTLSWLAIHVNPKFITGSWLHSSGGIPFFGVALLFLMPVVWILRKTEGGGHKAERPVHKFMS